MIRGILNFIDARLGIGFDVAPKEAIAYFKAKGLRPSFSYLDTYKEEHVTAVTVAKMLDMDLLKDVDDSIHAALTEGLSYQQWADRITPTLQAAGWWGRKAVKDPVTGKTIIAELGSSRRLQIIFRTNMQSAYAVGKWQQIKAQAKEAPYLMYDAVDDYRTRPQHRAWDNTVLPITDVFWTRHYPPNGWGCRCGVIQLSEDDLKAMGLSVSKSPKTNYINWQNPRTGKTEKIPEGVDPGFDFNPGQSRYNQLREMAGEKAESLPDDLQQPAKESLDKIEQQANDDTAHVMYEPDLLNVDDVVKLGGDIGKQLKLDDLIKVAGRTDPASIKWQDAADEWRNRLVGLIEKTRGTGGKINTITGSSPIGVTWLQEAVNRYPADWVAKAEQDGDLFVGLSVDVPEQRGFLSPVAQPGVVMGYGAEATLTTDDYIIFIDRDSVTTHEYAHRIQMAAPEIDYFFQAEHRKRTGGDPLKKLDDLTPNMGYGEDEVTREDHYYNPYQGREYPDLGAAEVMTMTLEPLLGIRGGCQFMLHDLIRKDQRMVELALGLLLHVKPR